MTTITTRAGKGAPLTNAELDANFLSLKDNKLEVGTTTSDISEGSNQYFTDARARAALSATGSLSYNSSTGVFSFTQGNSDTVTEGSTNLYYTDARARGALSFSAGSGGYNASTGEITIPTNTNQLTNGAGYITGINSSAVTSALGYTPANKAGDTFSGNVTLPVLLCSGSGNGVVLEGRDTASNGFTMYVSGNTYRAWSNSASADRLTLDSSGNLTAVGNVTAYSDERLKTGWTPVGPEFITRLASVKSGTYMRVDTQEWQAGVSAQEWQTVLPETVTADENGFLSVAYGNAALVAAIELAKEVRSLKAEIEKLKGK